MKNIYSLIIALLMIVTLNISKVSADTETPTPSETPTVTVTPSPTPESLFPTADATEYYSDCPVATLDPNQYVDPNYFMQCYQCMPTKETTKSLTPTATLDWNGDYEYYTVLYQNYGAIGALYTDYLESEYDGDWAEYGDFVGVCRTASGDDSARAYGVVWENPQDDTFNPFKNSYGDYSPNTDEGKAEMRGLITMNNENWMALVVSQYREDTGSQTTMTNVITREINEETKLWMYQPRDIYVYCRARYGEQQQETPTPTIVVTEQPTEIPKNVSGGYYWYILKYPYTLERFTKSGYKDKPQWYVAGNNIDGGTQKAEQACREYASDAEPVTILGKHQVYTDNYYNLWMGNPGAYVTITNSDTWLGVYPYAEGGIYGSKIMINKLLTDMEGENITIQYTSSQYYQDNYNIKLMASSDFQTYIVCRSVYQVAPNPVIEPTATPTMTSTPVTGYCNNWDYLDTSAQNQIASVSNIQIYPPEEIILLRGDYIDLSWIGSERLSEIGWPTIALSVIKVDLGEIYLLGFRLPIEMIVLPFVLFAISLLMRL